MIRKIKDWHAQRCTETIPLLKFVLKQKSNFLSVGESLITLYFLSTKCKLKCCHQPVSVETHICVVTVMAAVNQLLCP